MRFTSVKADLNLKEVTLNAQTGDFNPASLAEQLNQRPINELVVKSWIDRAGKPFLPSCLYTFQTPRCQPSVNQVLSFVSTSSMSWL
jgi:hypothetical protein